MKNNVPKNMFILDTKNNFDLFLLNEIMFQVEKYYLTKFLYLVQ